MHGVPYTLVLVLAAFTALLAPAPSPAAALVVGTALAVRLAVRYHPRVARRPRHASVPGG
ncbi:MAG: hypothetical protein JWQ53_246 [Klenkia sp.]|nr:hypothetical protein [Klenkia sp.]